MLQIGKVLHEVEAEVDWAREMGGRLQRVNTDLARENAELIAKTKEGDREREKSIRDLVALKKDTQHLKLENERVDHELAEWRARAAFLAQAAAYASEENLALLQRLLPRIKINEQEPHRGETLLIVASVAGNAAAAEIAMLRAEVAQQQRHSNR